MLLFMCLTLMIVLSSYYHDTFVSLERTNIFVQDNNKSENLALSDRRSTVLM